MFRRDSLGWTDWIHPDSFRAAIIRHEGYGRDTLVGHQGQIEAALAWETCGDAAALVEGLVAATEGDAEKLRRNLEHAANKTFENAAGHHNVHGHIRAQIPYWRPGWSNPLDSLFEDTPGPDNVKPQPCDWSIF